MMKGMFRLVRRATLSVASMVWAVSSVQAQSGLVTLPNQVPSVVKQSSLIAKVPSNQVLHLAVSLLLPNQSALEAFDKSVSDPKSSNYRKFLTPEQVGAEFGPAPANVSKVVDYLKSYGFTIKLVAKSGFTILADATAAQAEAAFNTTLNQYHSLVPNDTERVDYYSFSTPLKVPASVGNQIQHVSGLVNHAKPHPRLVKRKKQLGPGYLTAVTTAVFYNTEALHTAGYTGKGRTVGISGFDGFHLANVPFYVSANNLPIPATGVGTNISVVTIDGGSENGATYGEGDLDLQMEISQAPLANIIVYDGVDSELNVLTQEADDNKIDTASESYGWGFDIGDAEASHAVHLQMTAQGITYMCAAGDTGTNQQDAPYPDEDPQVTNVGGTSIVADASGARVSESSWGGDGAGGGGWMTQAAPFNVLSSWQVGNGVPTTPNFRLFPDVSFDSDPATGEQIYLSAGTYFGSDTLTAGFYVVGGTSEASPICAASIAVVEQDLIATGNLAASSAGKYRLGLINPLIYQENGRPDVYYDVTTGPSNGELPNGVVSLPGPGWDTATGWGSMNFFKFASTFNLTPPKTITAQTPIPAYDGLGKSLEGTKNQLFGTSSTAYFSESSIASAAGQVAAATLTFDLTAKPPTLASAALTIKNQAPSNVTSFIYAKNGITGNWDIVSTIAMSGSPITTKLLLNLADYDVNGVITVIVRDLYPTRLGANSFTSKIYQATITETF